MIRKLIPVFPIEESSFRANDSTGPTSRPVDGSKKSFHATGHEKTTGQILYSIWEDLLLSAFILS